MQHRRLKYILLLSIGLPLIRAALRLLWRTLRIEYRNADRVLHLASVGTFFLFSFWHGDMPMALLAGAEMVRRRIGRCAVLASLSEDGELLARTVRRFGIEPIRGSSSHGARSGLKGLERHLKSGGHVGVAVDGPLGPRHSAKLGVAVLAKNTGALILPFTVRCERSWRLRSWDRTEIPKPFSRCVATFHEPIAVAPAADRGELERVRLGLERILLEGANKG